LNISNKHLGKQSQQEFDQCPYSLGKRQQKDIQMEIIGAKHFMNWPAGGETSQKLRRCYASEPSMMTIGRLGLQRCNSSRTSPVKMIPSAS